MRGMKFVAVPAVMLVLASACTTASSTGSTNSVKIAVVQEATGPYAAYADQFNTGLKAGLDHVTDGTGKINGTKLEVTYSDSGGNPTKAVSSAKDLIGKGHRFIVGTVDSGIALQLAPIAEDNDAVFIPDASTDKLTGINDHTFRASMQTWQQIATTGEHLGLKGKRVALLKQDSAFGSTYEKSLSQYLKDKKLPVPDATISVPMQARDFTPFAVKVAAAKPDVLFTAFAGAAKAKMFTALDEQGVLDTAKTTAELPTEREHAAFGDSAGKGLFYARYTPGAVDTPQDKALRTWAERHDGVNEQISVNGFTTAQMIAHAVRKGGTDTAKQRAALEGWDFQGPTGTMRIRAADHAMLQPMLVTKLVKKGSGWRPKLVTALGPDDTAPPRR